MKIDDSSSNPLMLAAKKQIQETASFLIAAGIPPLCVISGMGSSLGNLVGLFIVEDAIEEAVDAMRSPIISDARLALAMKKSLSR